MLKTKGKKFFKKKISKHLSVRTYKMQLTNQIYTDSTPLHICYMCMCTCGRCMCAHTHLHTRTHTHTLSQNSITLDLSKPAITRWTTFVHKFVYHKWKARVGVHTKGGTWLYLLRYTNLAIPPPHFVLFFAQHSHKLQHSKASALLKR